MKNFKLYDFDISSNFVNEQVALLRQQATFSDEEIANKTIQDISNNNIKAIDLKAMQFIFQQLYFQNSDQTSINIFSMYIEKLGSLAFFNDTSEHIVINEHVREISQFAFLYSNIISAVFKHNYSSLTLGKSTFRSCSNLIYLDMSYVLIDEIPKRCFENCSSLRTALIPSVLYIREQAFNECNNLKTIDIRSSIIIESRAFYNCNINSLIFTNNLESIGDKAFAFNDLDYIEFGNNINSNINFGTNVFENSLTWIIDEIDNNLQNMISTNNLTNYFFNNQQLSTPVYNIVTTVPFFINTQDHDIYGSMSDPYHRLGYSSHKNIVIYSIDSSARYTNNAVKFNIDPLTLNINFIDETLTDDLELGLHIIGFSVSVNDNIGTSTWVTIENYTNFNDVSNNTDYNYIFFAKRCRFLTIKNIPDSIDPRWVKKSPIDATISNTQDAIDYWNYFYSTNVSRLGITRTNNIVTGYYSGDVSKRENNITILNLIEEKYNNFNNVFYQYDRINNSDISGNILFKYNIIDSQNITYETNNFYKVYDKINNETLPYGTIIDSQSGIENEYFGRVILPSISPQQTTAFGEWSEFIHWIDDPSNYTTTTILGGDNNICLPETIIFSPDKSFFSGYTSNNNLIYYNASRNKINLNNINLIKVNQTVYNINFLLPHNSSNIGYAFFYVPGVNEDNNIIEPFRIRNDLQTTSSFSIALLIQTIWNDMPTNSENKMSINQISEYASYNNEFKRYILRYILYNIIPGVWEEEFSTTIQDSEVITADELIALINRETDTLSTTFNYVNNTNNIVLKIVKEFSGYILMIPNDNTNNTNVLVFDNTCSVDLNYNIYCLHPLETNFIKKTTENNITTHYLRIFNNYNSISSYKQFDLSSNDINNSNYETHKFYIGVNIGNYILDLSDTSGALIDMEGSDKTNIEIFGNSINKYYDNNNTEYLENELTSNVILANSNNILRIETVFIDKLYINVYNKFQESNKVKLPKIILNNLCIELYYTDWCNDWTNYENDKFMPENI